MPSRRPHTKDRHGCTTCKQRKVRCDQERPICRNCTRLGRKCGYSETTTKGKGRLRISSDDNDDNASKGSSLCTGHSPCDMELLHFWTARCYFTMTDSDKAYPIWQFNIPRHALSHPFLMHGLLALSALQLRLESSPSQRSAYFDLAKTHQEQALAAYIPLLKSINQHNCHALFAFSATIGSLSFAFLQVSSYDLDDEELIESVISIIDLLVGATVVAYQAKHWLHQGDLEPMFGIDGPQDTKIVELEQGPRMALEALLGRVHSMTFPEDHYGIASPSSGANLKESYISRIHGLANTLPHTDGQPTKISPALGWPVFDSTYVSALKNNDVPALVILGIYGASLHALNHIWWLDGIGTRLVRAVSAVVPDDWQPYLAWALDFSKG